MNRLFAALAALLFAWLVALDAQAAPPWVDRTITLPAGHWAFDVGLGIGHDGFPPEDTAAGFNFEMAVSPVDRLEIGVRTGLRIGDRADRAMPPNGADAYGRLFDRQYFDPGAAILADPEVRVRGALVRGPVVELGLEGRLLVPVDANDAGLEAGMPLAFHLGGSVRLDTGIWVPIVFGQAAQAGISAPLDVWIQVTPHLWLGPMTGLASPRINDTPAWVSFGFGLGYQFTHALDLKTMLLFPELNVDDRIFGAGVGIQVRIE